MKKITFLLMALAAVMTVQAERLRADGQNPGTGYTYLTFETTDGAKVSVPVSSLTMTISGNTLTASSEIFFLDNLSKMYFTSDNETMGVEEVTVATLDEAAEIYDLNGRKTSKSQMKRGAYIVKTKQKTFKMIVK